MSAHHNSQELKKIADKLRLNIIHMVVKAKGGHLGGSFSVIDILVGLYLGNFLKYDPKNPKWSERDYFIFSKGHSCLALYNVLVAAGYFEKEILNTYCCDGGMLAGHPKHDSVPGVEISSGSLGHGLPISVGLALAHKLKSNKNKTICLVGDGECNEGSVWEALMAGAQFKLKNLILIIDSNKLESLDLVENILSIEPLGSRLRDFGWQVKEIDGHNISQLLSVLNSEVGLGDRPLAIIAHTIKGKGVSFMENDAKWHHRKLTQEEALLAIKEIEERIDNA